MSNSTENYEAGQNMNTYNKTSGHIKESFTLETTSGFSKQHLFYILNTTFLVIIAFAAGYKVNNWQMKRNISDMIRSTEVYFQKAKANYEKSEQLLLDAEKRGRHFQAEVIEKQIVTKTVTPLSTPVKAETPPIKTIELQVKKTMPVQPAAPPKKVVKQKKGGIFPKQTIPSVKIAHTIQNGELLSSLVRKAAMADFLKDNPQISNPDVIYPGQKIFISIPLQSIRTGSYLNNYFIRPAKTENGKTTYVLKKSLDIPESETLISYIIQQPKEVILKKTAPYINLSDFTNTMKEEIWGKLASLQSRSDKINMVTINQTGTYFETISDHPVFRINTYKGVRAAKQLDYFTHIDILKGYLIKYLASLHAENKTSPFFHFLIFGDTIVQINFLEASTYSGDTDKSRILIGIVFRNKKTSSSLLKLQSALATCKSRQGEIIELTEKNFRYYE